jgi:DNA polymerase IV
MPDATSELKQSSHGFCRDCCLRLPPEAASAVRCPNCRSPRLVRHAELFGLAIAHIDCDAFYAAIEKRDNPDLRDKPLIIGGGTRGVVSTACYIARISGVRSAMPMFEARKLCPEAVILPPNMAKYQKAGKDVRSLMLELTPLVEPLSIDEAFLNLSGTEKLHKSSPAESLARLALKIEREIGITVSIGLSHNKFLAKIASDLNKPRGFSVIGKAETVSFLADKPVRFVWGIGQKTSETLAKDGLMTLGQIQSMPERELVARYGKLGAHLWHLARGNDERIVDPEGEAKSVSAETTFDVDIAELDALARELWRLCEKVSDRLKRAGLAGGNVHLKLKTAGFRIISRQMSLSAPTQLAETLFRCGRTLLQREATGQLYRLIGIGVGDIREAADADPMDLADPDGAQRRKVEAAIDAVRAKLGKGSIGKGRGFEGRRR